MYHCSGFHVHPSIFEDHCANLTPLINYSSGFPLQPSRYHHQAIISFLLSITILFTLIAKTHEKFLPVLYVSSRLLAFFFFSLLSPLSPLYHPTSILFAGGRMLAILPAMSEDQVKTNSKERGKARQARNAHSHLYVYRDETYR